jgi:ribonucleoside-diphosphate reductase alpha chain
MLDNVLQQFIENAPDTISRAKYSAMRERSIGLGTLGFHAYLQKKHIPFESALAKSANMKIFKNIRSKMDEANVRLANERGACPDAQKHGYNVRFSHMLAIAPNASTSLIMGNTSPSIEPYRANVFRQDTLSGAHVYKNRFLEKILEKKCEELKLDINEVWASIISNDGSVQHLDWLDDYTKDVYKTAPELDQRWIIELASDRQEFVDQGQSVNIFFRPDVNIRYLHAVHFQAWKQGLKSLYYCRSDKLRKADRVGQKVERKKIEDEIDLKKLAEGDECLACT